MSRRGDGALVMVMIGVGDRVSVGTPGSLTRGRDEDQQHLEVL